MIGITFALPSESSDLIARLREVRHEEKLILGKIESRDVAIAHTGVGAKNSNIRLEFLLHKTRPRLVISAGFAGAVTNELHSGDLILGENFSDRQTLARATEILREPKPRAVKLFTATSIIDSTEKRNQIARDSGAVAVDMETGAIANLCNAHGVPLLSLRAISDSPSEPFPAPPAVLFDLERQRTNFVRLVGYLFRHPSAVPRLGAFSKQIALARAILTEALVEIIRGL